jgi:hypothetical protein
MKFMLKADCTFQAKDIEDAFSLLEDHFMELLLQLQVCGSPQPESLMDAGMIGYINIEPVTEETTPDDA